MGIWIFSSRDFMVFNGDLVTHMKCIHAYMHTCIHTSIHTYIHPYMHTCIHAYIHTYTCFFWDVDIWYTHTYIYIMCVCVWNHPSCCILGQACARRWHASCPANPPWWRPREENWNPRAGKHTWPVANRRGNKSWSNCWVQKKWSIVDQ